MLDVAPLVNGEPHEALLESSPPRPTSITHVAIASFVGTAIEWYDFFLYGTAAALVFNKLFFPRFDPLVGTILAFATFAVGFVARPIGGVVFGHYGDRIGRKAMLSITLLIMGVATFAIGLLPTYAQIGIGAPILLVTLRLAQGFGLGRRVGRRRADGDRARPGRRARLLRELAADRCARGAPPVDRGVRAVSRLPEPALPELGLASSRSS